MKAANTIYEVLSHTIGPLTAQRSNLRILMYHRIQSEPHSSAYLHPKDFAEQMAFLKDLGYATYSLRHLYENWPAILDGPKAVVLTFDDVWASQVDTVLPVLKRHDFVGTFFVPTGHIENQRHKPRFSDLMLFDAELCSWKDIDVLQDAGMEIGAHTHTHRMLSKLSIEQVHEELSVSCQILSEHCRESVISFAYPFGKRKTFNPAIMEIVREHDFKIACTTLWGCPTKTSNLLALPRIGIHGSDHLENFRKKLNGRHDYRRWIYPFL